MTGEMQGMLADLPLLNLLELIHGSRQSGVLDVQAQVPFSVAFRQGEVVSGGILDWLGLDALYSTPLTPYSGSFTFTAKPVTGWPLGAFGHLITDWAKISDEWEKLMPHLGSPSRCFRGPRPLFEGVRGRSVRSAARRAELPLLPLAQAVVKAVNVRQLEPLDRFEWLRLKLLPSAQRLADNPVPALLDGERTLGDLLTLGATTAQLRDYLLSELRLGLRFKGSGWVLRDLLWEKRYLAGL